MPTFTYRALTDKNESQTGVMEAPDRKVVMQRLRSSKLRPVEIQAKGGTTSAAAITAAAMARTATLSARDTSAAKAALARGAAANKPAPPAKILEPAEFAGDKVALGLLKKLYQLHSGGMPLGDCIRLLSVRVTDPRQASLATRLWKDLSEGRPLATAMRAYPKTFDTSMVHLIEAGESTGNLVPVMENLIAHLEERMHLRKTILGGLAYPLFICTLAFGVLLLFLYFLLPAIEKMMRSMGGEITGLTALLVGISKGSITYGPWILVAGIATAVFLYQWRQKPDGRAATDAWLLKLPFLKKIFLNTDICRIANLCATLLESGVNTTETLRMTERSVGNTVVQSRFSAARVLINDGASFSNAFRHYGVLPDLDLDVLAVGENTGNIAKSFREIYRVHSQELAEQFKLLSVMITAGALGTAFVMVAVLVLGIVSAVLKVSSQLTKG